MNMKISSLNVIYKNKSHCIHALDKVKLEIKAGECTALIGESGSGKSTLANACLGILPKNTCFSGSIALDNSPLNYCNEETINQFRWKKIALAFQNGAANLNPVQKIIDQVTEPLLIHTDIDKATALKIASQSLNKLGLSPDQLLLFPHQLSGGQLQRVMLTMALILDPEVIILDEPTACLDAITKSLVANVIEENKHKNKAILLITHDLEFAANNSNTIAVLYAGQIMEQLPAKHLLTSPKHPYTMALARSYPATNTARDLGGIKGDFCLRTTHNNHDQPTHRHLTHNKLHGEHNTNHIPIDGCLFHNRCTQELTLCKHQKVKLIPQQDHHIRCLRNGIVNILELKEASKSHDGIVALHKNDLTIKAGEVFSLVGESGSGKSTLAMIAAGILKTDSGKRIFKGKNMDELIKYNYKSLSKQIGFIFQNQSSALSHRFNIFEAIAEPFRIHKITESKEELLVLVKKLLTDVHLPTEEAFLKYYPHQLNQGSLQRVGIARALALKPSFLIADEPTSSLDPSVQAKVVKLLLELQIELGLSMLFITHDIGLARKISDRLGVILQGQLVEIGPASLLFGTPAHPYTKFLIDSAAGLAKIYIDHNQTTTPLKSGCSFSMHCPRAREHCHQLAPQIKLHGERLLACHYPLPDYIKQHQSNLYIKQNISDQDLHSKTLSTIAS
ncbi:MAG: ABC transporter ATP-binding protein [Desulfobulbaceae bacterium]|nr:ABC transporter ATP-binding protein [Desulfobulbaceae bacterium]